MRILSRSIAGGFLLVPLSLAGCASRADADAAALAQAGAEESPPETTHMGFVREALGKVSLRPEQRPIVEQLAREAEIRHESIHQARSALHGALADQIVTGKIDRAALRPQIDTLLSAVEQSRAADRVAFGRLHDVLDKGQRNQFVDALEAGVHGRAHHEHGAAMRRWATDLKLSDAQTEQIRSAFKAKFAGQRETMSEPFRAAREQGQKMLESFRQDQFTPDPDAPLFGRDKAERRIARTLDLAEVAVPVLTPEQRAIAAQKIRTRAGGL